MAMDKDKATDEKKTDDWIMANADKFEMDCRPDRRDDTGIETPDYIREEIERRASKPRDASSTPSADDSSAKDE